jgi:hypothetical protein
LLAVEADKLLKVELPDICWVELSAPFKVIVPPDAVNVPLDFAQSPETLKSELVVMVPAIDTLVKASVLELVMAPPDIVMVPALGEKVPVTFSPFPTVAVFEFPEIDPEILRGPYVVFERIWPVPL